MRMILVFRKDDKKVPHSLMQLPNGKVGRIYTYPGAEVPIGVPVRCNLVETSPTTFVASSIEEIESKNIFKDTSKRGEQLRRHETHACGYKITVTSARFMRFTTLQINDNPPLLFTVEDGAAKLQKFIDETRQNGGRHKLLPITHSIIGNALIGILTLHIHTIMGIPKKGERSVKIEAPILKKIVPTIALLLMVFHQGFTFSPGVVTSYSQIITAKTPEGVIARFKHAAIQNEEVYGIPAALQLAQAILETGSGKSRLCKDYNNWFGIRASQQCMECPKAEGGKSFRYYANAADSWQDHARLLGEHPRYAFLAHQPIEVWLSSAAFKRYARDPNYTKKLNKIIQRYNLNKI